MFKTNFSGDNKIWASQKIWGALPPNAPLRGCGSLRVGVIGNNANCKAEQDFNFECLLWSCGGSRDTVVERHHKQPPYNRTYLHPGYFQARGGCACAGPYAQDLLGIDEDKAKKFEEALLEDRWVSCFAATIGQTTPGFAVDNDLVSYKKCIFLNNEKLASLPKAMFFKFFVLPWIIWGSYVSASRCFVLPPDSETYFNHWMHWVSRNATPHFQHTDQGSLVAKIRGSQIHCLKWTARKRSILHRNPILVHPWLLASETVWKKLVSQTFLGGGCFRGPQLARRHWCWLTTHCSSPVDWTEFIWDVRVNIRKTKSWGPVLSESTFLTSYLMTRRTSSSTRLLWWLRRGGGSSLSTCSTQKLGNGGTSSTRLCAAGSDLCLFAETFRSFFVEPFWSFVSQWYQNSP